MVDLRLLDESGKVLCIVDGLHLRQLTQRSPLADDTLAVAWQKVARLPEVALPARGAFLCLLDLAGTGAQLRARLRERGQRCVGVIAGTGDARIETDLYQIDPADPRAYRRLLADVFGDHEHCLGVVHLWSLDAGSRERSMADDLDDALFGGCISATYLAQALLGHGFRAAPRLWLVTRGVQAVGDRGKIAVAQAPLWGLGKTIALEHPELQCTCIDLDPAAGGGEIDALERELAATDREDQIVLRGGERHVARIIRIDVGSEETDETSPGFRGDATYLLTGGLGGLGLELARWMVERGARHLVLVGRRGPTDAALAVVAAMRAAGARIDCVEADVSQCREVEQVVATIAAGMPPLRGVVHAAGVLDDRTLLSQTEQTFRTVFAPKGRGAWNLHQATLGTPLDFFVMYSSAASLFGSPGQANYAAANALLDALSRERSRLGLPSTSIQWGPFAQVGLAAGQQDRGERLARQGMLSLRPEEGLRTLARVLTHSRAEVGVVRFDRPRWLAFHAGAAHPPAWAELLAAPGEAAVTASTVDLRAALDRAGAGERRATLERFVIVMVAQVMRMDRAQLGTDDCLSRLGIDSLMSLELRNRLERELRLALPVQTLRRADSIAAIVTYIMDRLSLESLMPPVHREGDQDESIEILL